MPLTSSGQISLNDLHVEAGGTSGTQVSMNDTDIRGLVGAVVNSQMAFSSFYGASSSATINITISSNTNNYNLWNSKGGAYSAGNTTINVTINSGVTIGSTSTGTYAFDTGTGWASGDTITIINNGIVKGKGGNGGDGADVTNNSSGGLVSSSAAGAGGAGGSAFRAQFATSITNNGTFAGGGGGGGGGGATRYYNLDSKTNSISFSVIAGGGGGGAAGVNAGSGGASGRASGFSMILSQPAVAKSINAFAGSSGTAISGGLGGNGRYNNVNAGASTNNKGGDGGGLGSAGTSGLALAYLSNYLVQNGGAGGASGNYAVGNSNITWTVTGTRQGGVS